MKKLLALVMALTLLGSVVLVAAAEEGSGGLPAWAYAQVADGYSMGLFGDEIYTAHDKIITQDQLTALTQTAADKLALLNVPANPEQGEALVIDTTRGGVLNALYQAAAAYNFPNINQDPIAYMESLGAVCGNGSSLMLDRPCTLLEAAIFANRMILELYDSQNAGSLGLLWKAENEENTLYLLGSIHTDRNNLYPFHKQLRDIITGAELVALELDFNDQEGLLEFAAMQMYSDGTTLKDHISPELYQEVVEALEPLGMSEAMTAVYKPWALANTFTALSVQDETTGSNAMAIDLYVNAKAANAGIPVAGIETYAFQGGIFEDLSPEYQEDYLTMTLAMFQGETEDMDEETLAAFQSQNAAVGEWMDQWKARDISGFSESYPKDEILASDSENDAFTRKLFEGRDPNMAAWASDYLTQEGSHTGLLTVGAGHMIGSTGIVQRLKDMGYTVEELPLP